MRRGWMDGTKKLVLVCPKVIKQSIVLRTYERGENEKKVECYEVVGGVGSRELSRLCLRILYFVPRMRSERVVACF